jgi:hypothetical protein
VAEVTSQAYCGTQEKRANGRHILIQTATLDIFDLMQSFSSGKIIIVMDALISDFCCGS